jgi:cytochrome b561
MKSFVGVAHELPDAANVPTRRATVGVYRMPAKVFHWVTVGLVVFMVSSGVVAKQLGDGDIANTMFSIHKLTGVLTLMIIVLRLGYRMFRSMPELRFRPRSRAALHLSLYVVILLVPALGWAGISDFGAREIFPGISLPQIWPEGAGYDELLLHWHAYLAFALLALVAVHIGVALQDYMAVERSSNSDR